MARQIVVLALVMIALVGLVSAAIDPPKSNMASTTPAPAGANEATTPNNDDTIGNTNDEAAGAPSNEDGGVVEGPMGSEEEAKAHGGAAQAPSPSGSATTLGVSVVTTASVVAGYFVF